MATIRRHAVPAESYEPDRPLNDLGRDQLRHFIHAAQQLPPRFSLNLAAPSPEDGPACTRYIAAVTERLLAMRNGGLAVVPRRPRKSSGGDLDLAASASPTKVRKAPASKQARAKTAKPGGHTP